MLAITVDRTGLAGGADDTLRGSRITAGGHRVTCSSRNAFGVYTEITRDLLQRRIKCPSSRRRTRRGPSLIWRAYALQNHFLDAPEELPRSGSGAGANGDRLSLLRAPVDEASDSCAMPGPLILFPIGDLYAATTRCGSAIPAERAKTGRLRPGGGVLSKMLHLDFGERPF